MTSFDVSGTRGPWVVFGPARARESGVLRRQLDALADRGGRVHTFRAADLDDAAGVFREFADTFRFPGYFGRNWDAVVDCLDDLCAEVTGGIGTAGVIEGADSLLGAPHLRLFVSVLCQGAARANAAADPDGDSLPRPATAQHFVFLLDEHEAADFADALTHPDLTLAGDGPFLTVTLDPEAW
ncbi:barstar family protein [Streptomyces sp. NPDC101490]|uniref:barstar family protein n=1 Tax=Streptomyces sp. NPDC101490 TaxID=3366143 RepID=UPI003821BE09